MDLEEPEIYNDLIRQLKKEVACGGVRWGSERNVVGGEEE